MSHEVDYRLKEKKIVLVYECVAEDPGFVSDADPEGHCGALWERELPFKRKNYLRAKLKRMGSRP